MRGRQRFCPPCGKLNRQKLSRDGQARERLRNPSVGAERSKRYRAAHPDRVKETSRRQYVADVDKKRAYRDLTRFGAIGLGVLHRDEYRCRLCQATADDGIRNLIIHHIDGTKVNNTTGNLITLCRKCHPSIHNRFHGATRQDELRALVG
jgi:5-methylcytosine-specific restriction endonuclease McrA